MGFPCLRCESYQQQINFEQAGFPSRVCRLLGGQRLLICTKASSLSSASTSSTSNNTSGAQLVIVKVVSLLLVDFFFIALELQDHINFSGLGGLSALAGENDPRAPPPSPHYGLTGRLIKNANVPKKVCVTPVIEPFPKNIQFHMFDILHINKMHDENSGWSC